MPSGRPWADRMAAEARWWKNEGASVRCLLCPHLCVIGPGGTGLCGVRAGAQETNGRGSLSLPGYGFVTAEAADPIEKKPLYHFLPGSPVWSIGFAGCNLDCPFCQNHEIARAPAGSGRRRTPDEVVAVAASSGSRMIAYTYSEPTVHFEFVVAAAERARKAGLKNVLVTNGCLNPGPAAELLDLMDAVNIDVKSWNPTYYRDVLRGNLATVRAFVEAAVERCWTELTTLVVPDDNDSDTDMAEMCSWIASLSPVIPLHLSAYHPSYKYGRSATDAESLRRFRNVAKGRLTFVYVGNIGWENDTACPGCGAAVIERKFYSTRSALAGNACPECGTVVPGVFDV